MQPSTATCTTDRGNRANPIARNPPQPSPTTNGARPIDRSNSCPIPYRRSRSALLSSMTGSCCNRARHQAKSFHAEARPPAEPNRHVAKPGLSPNVSATIDGVAARPIMRPSSSVSAYGLAMRQLVDATDHATVEWRHDPLRPEVYGLPGVGPPQFCDWRSRPFPVPDWRRDQRLWCTSGITADELFGAIARARTGPGRRERRWRVLATHAVPMDRHRNSVERCALRSWSLVLGSSLLGLAPRGNSVVPSYPR
jgi:hypothetical protein